MQKIVSSRLAVAIIFAVLALASPGAEAQEQRGSIEGTVKDTSGGVLPGVTVEARSPSLVGVATAVTDAQGIYRFPALVPGRYEVTAILQGFQPGKAENIRLELGQILKVDLSLQVGSITETVQVSGESSLIDVKQNAAGASVGAEIIDRIPKGRDFTTIVTSAPGINDESRSRGIQIDGSSGADNRYMVDGVDTTDLRYGTSGKTVAPDFVKEVQVKASGYSAEYRASIGGVISAITKTGSNEWHGGFGSYYTTEKLQGDIRPNLRLNPANQKIAEYVTTPPDKWYNAEIVADLGGPIFKDHLWFYAGFNPIPQRTERTVIFRDNTAAGPQTFVSQPLPWTLNYNVTGTIGNNLRGKFAVSNSQRRGGYSLPGIEPDGTSTANSTLFPAVVRNDSYNNSYSGVLDWVPNNRTYVNVTTTYLGYGSHDAGQFSDEIIHSFSGSNFQFPEIPPALQHVSGYSDNRSSSRQVRDNYYHFNIDAVATRFQTWKGQHMLKAGIQIERIGHDLLSGAQQPTVTLYWDASRVANDGSYRRGKYGYYGVSRSYSTGDVVARNYGLFVQDSWSINQNLTLNLGVRTENEDAPSYRPENPGVHFGFGDKIAPRAGFAWDVRGDSRWKVYGSWGSFYDLMKLGLGYVMFGATRWVTYYYTLDTYDWASIGGAYPPVPGQGYPGTFIDSYDYRTVANDPKLNLVDPDLHPIRMQEFTLGLDHELTPTMSGGVRFVHKWVDYAIEAVCLLVGGQEQCGVNNPGFGTGKWPFGRDFPAQPPAGRDYDGLEFRLRKRFANRWSMDASYLLSRLWGNWSGIAGTDDAYSGLQPYAGRNFDFLYYSFDANGNVTNGLLGTDRPHQFKVQGTYDLPWGTQIGVSYLLESGTPPGTVISYKPGINFFPYGRNDLPRYAPYSKTDLLIQQEFRFPGRARLSVGLNASNLFDQKIVTGNNNSPYRDQFSVGDAVFFSGWDPKAVAAANPAIRPQPMFGMANAWEARRVIRLQAKFTF